MSLGYVLFAGASCLPGLASRLNEEAAAQLLLMLLVYRRQGSRGGGPDGPAKQKGDIVVHILLLCIFCYRCCSFCFQALGKHHSCSDEHFS